MSLDLGYLVSSRLLRPLPRPGRRPDQAKRFHPFLYWGAIVGTTLAGTTMADFADRSLGIGYPGGSAILFVSVDGFAGVWHVSRRHRLGQHRRHPATEMFYWLTILFSNTLGTALGDWDIEGPGFGGASCSSSRLSPWSPASTSSPNRRTILFWTAFILTRPLGASMGDLLTKPHADGGLNLSRFAASGAIALFVIVLLFPQRAGDHPGNQD